MQDDKNKDEDKEVNKEEEKGKEDKGEKSKKDTEDFNDSGNRNSGVGTVACITGGVAASDAVAAYGG